MNLINNGQMNRGKRKLNPIFALMTEENHETTPVSLVGTGIRTRDFSNTNPVCYHCATSLGALFLFHGIE